MPAILLIGIPIVVVILFWGIMSLPDDEPENPLAEDTKPAPVTRKKTTKKKKRK